MKVFWESDDWPGSNVDPAITCLSWIPSKDDPTGGFIGAGSESGAVGVTRTDLLSYNTSPSPIDPTDNDKRDNFNLRGHHSPISIVAWNTAQTKLASCDLSGIIYVWVPNEERWSVELVNDRGVKVRDFSWSPSGASALICYDDNFVLIGSATGQRVWSNSFAQTVLCGVWAPDSREIIIGLSTGSIQVLTEQGATVTDRLLSANKAVERLASSAVRNRDGRWTLCVCIAGGELHFLRSYDDADPTIFRIDLKVVAMQWSANGEYLAAIATSDAPSVNQLYLFSDYGHILHSTSVPVSSDRLLTAFTWAHDDQAVVVAAGGQLAVGRVVHSVPSLFLLVSYKVWSLLGGNRQSVTAVDRLPLPGREKSVVKALDHHLIRCRIPYSTQLSASVCRPTCWRWYCTIRPVPRKTQAYMLCTEHMGGLVPVLIGRQINRILPEFEIGLPRSNERSKSSSTWSTTTTPTPTSRSTTPEIGGGLSAQVEDKSADMLLLQRTSLHRNSMWRRSKRQLRAMVHRAQQHVPGHLNASSSSNSKYDEKLVQVTSNVWCTRFKVTGMSDNKLLPPYLAQVVYKTSVLHLQPRQMTVHLVDLQRRSALTAPISASQLDYGLTDDCLNAMQVENGPPIAPFDSEIFVGGGGVGGGGAIAAGVDLDDATETDELLMSEERVLLHHVLGEFSDLRAAVDRHISRMREFAADLQRSSDRLDDQPTASSTSLRPSVSTARHCSEPPMMSTHSDDDWQLQLDTMQFIDEDDELVITSEAERRRLRPRTLSCSSSGRNDTTTVCQQQTSSSSVVFARPAKYVVGGGARQLSEITSVLDKLCKMANDLTQRSVGDGGPPTTTINNRHQSNHHHRVDGVTQMRARIRDIAQRVSQLERRINYGNELLDEVRGDLHRRVQHIRSVLGDCSTTVTKQQQQPSSSSATSSSTAIDPNNAVLVMQNKTPFWNEQTQVYQLDFGGRVTQESAKNFQIEYQDAQVMQFGRIEQGSYTLDFCRPFSAVQAFAVALASITQRLK